MLTKGPAAVEPVNPLTSAEPKSPPDLSGHRHRQVIGYLGLALPLALVWLVRWRPNLAADAWSGTSISAYYWTGAVSLFAGLLAVLSVFLLTYRGYANESRRNEKGEFESDKVDRGAAIVAGIAAALVALFPTTPPGGIAPSWWAGWINTIHLVAAITLFSSFAFFSIWLFPKGPPNATPGPVADQSEARQKTWRNGIYYLCGAGILLSMAWAVWKGRSGQSIFWPESLALGFFAWSWLVKGRALRSITSTFAAKVKR